MNKTHLLCGFPVFCVVLLVAACGPKEKVVPPPVLSQPPPTVLFAIATREEVASLDNVIAKLEGSTITEVQTKLGGFLVKQTYKEGAAVKQGDLLFDLDPRPFQALSYQGKAGYIKIVSPVDGEVGRATPGLGDLVKPNEMLTTISTIDPIRATFALPEKYYRENADRISKIIALPLQERPESFEILHDDRTPDSHRGKFEAIDGSTLGAVRSVTASVLFPNPNGTWRPGQYARIRSISDKTGDATVVPQGCIREGQGTDKILVVKSDNTLEIRTVTTGTRMGASWVVTSGLRPGERVVVDGWDKCQAGEMVTPQPYVPPNS
jgi:multidrug efflux pump subunit AcrA (membrane-fusion protein)